MKFKYSKINRKWIGKGMHTEASTDIGYGIYDTVDNCWIGDDDGPVLYGDLMLARVSAQVQGVRLGYPPTRLIYKEYDYTRKRLKDTVQTQMTSETALRMIEDGVV